MSKMDIYSMFKSNKNLINGKFIAFEGIDCSGKNVQSSMLCQHLNKIGIKSTKVSFPNYSSQIGHVISKYLRGEYGEINSIPNEVISILFASNRVSFNSKISQSLAKGEIVIADRYSYSNVFSAAKDPDKSEEMIKFIEEVEFNELKNIKPDLNIFLHINSSFIKDELSQRKKREWQNGKEDIYELNEALANNASEIYFNLASEREDWLIIDQVYDRKRQTSDEVFSQILKKVMPIILNQEEKAKKE